MIEHFETTLAKVMLDCQKYLILTVGGNSMYPTLLDNDVIRIESKSQYFLGEILCFSYSSNKEILVHRLIRIDTNNNKYLCKGDNSLRVEHVAKECILGSVVLKNGSPFQCVDSIKARLSFLENMLFVRDHYSFEEFYATSFYSTYRTLVLSSNPYNSIISRNPLFCYKDLYDNNLAVVNLFGNTHFYTGDHATILRLLCFPQSLNHLLHYTKDALSIVIDLLEKDASIIIAAKQERNAL